MKYNTSAVCIISVTHRATHASVDQRGDLPRVIYAYVKALFASHADRVSFIEVSHDIEDGSGVECRSDKLLRLLTSIRNIQNTGYAFDNILILRRRSF